MNRDRNPPPKKQFCFAVVNSDDRIVGFLSGATELIVYTKADKFKLRIFGQAILK